jgi:Domain of unknown function (DUF4397)
MISVFTPLRRVRAAALGLFGAMALVPACGSSNGAGTTKPPNDASADGPDVDGASLEGASADGAVLDTGTPPDEAAVAEGAGDDGSALPPQTFLRVAQLSPDLPPIDLCVAPHGTSAFQGPLIAELASSLGGADAASPGIGYAQISAYVSVAAGQYDVRIVAAGASDCSAAVTGVSAGVSADAGVSTDAGVSADAGVSTDAGVSADVSVSATPTFVANAYSTILVAGERVPTGTDRGLTVTALVDDAVLSGQAVALRAVNTMPTAPSLDFGYGSFSAGWFPLLTNVAFASASAEAAPSVGAVDARGYLPLAPLASQALSARLSSGAASDAALAKSMTIDTGSVATVIALGGRTGDTAHPAALLLCIDNSPAGGLLSDCSIQSDAAADE